MSDSRRGSPYTWVTWVTKILAGEAKCVWAPWYKSHFKYDKIADAEDRAAFFEEWTKKHDAMSAARAAALKAEGKVVKMEDDAAFNLRGATTTLAGKPDVVALYGNQADVYEQKSGKRRESDKWQARLYLLALPLTWLGAAIKLRAFVEYRDGLVEVELTAADKAKIGATLQEIGGPAEPDRSPSAWECKYCDIKACPERAAAKPEGQTGLF